MPRATARVVAAMLALVAARAQGASCVPVSVAVGEHHALVLRGDRTVWAAGDNSWGQLGVAGIDHVVAPVEVTGLPPAVAVAAGQRHSMALAEDGTVWTWGSGEQGQLGDGRSGGGVVSDAPAPVPGLGSVVAIGAGRSHSLAVLADGTARAWGWNASGQLGDGSIGAGADSSVPVAVSGLTRAVAVAGGTRHSLALDVSGRVWAWGNNAFGQLGDGTNLTSPLPVRLGLTAITAIAAGGSHSMARRDSGSAWGWGDNFSGQLGNGTNLNSDLPNELPLSGVVAIACGTDHSLAVLSSGQVAACGGNVAGQQADGTNVPRATPSEVAGVAGATACGAGWLQSFVVLVDGSVAAWGRNDVGQLGSGVRGHASVPGPVAGVGGVSAPSAGNGFTAALAVGASTWGENAWGQLGDGTTSWSNAPVAVSGLAGASRLEAGEFHALAALPDGTVRAWGAGFLGTLGDGTATDSSVPVAVVDPDDPSGLLQGARDVAGGWYHSLAALDDGTARAWGDNSAGQLGAPGVGAASVPVVVEDPSDGSGRLTGITKVSAGAEHSLALKAGIVRAWGDNGRGQLGDGSFASSDVPVEVSGLTDVVDVAAGGRTSLALDAGGQVWAWGAGTEGQLGDGFASDSDLPQRVIGVTSAAGLAASWTHGLAVLRDGTMRAWGANFFGQLGDGTRTPRSQPVTVVDPAAPSQALTGVVAVAAGTAHSAAVLADGRVLTWGTNLQGALGRGAWGQERAPVSVLVPAAADADADGVIDACDNCLVVANASQLDADLDFAGDECDACTDTDGDGFGNPGYSANTCGTDLCPTVADSQGDADADGTGDACDPCTDTDGDGFGDPGFAGNACVTDLCPLVASSQADGDRDLVGDECDDCTDSDGDGFGDPGFSGNLCATDLCPAVADAQVDSDSDGRGDACDPCPADPGDRCVDVLRNGAVSARSFAQVAGVLSADGGPVLDPVADLYRADVAALPQVVVPGDGLPVGDGNPGVIVFYEVVNAVETLLVKRSGPDVVLRGW